jgi:23S rRNA (guanosine2251-2'-O)-methyltransferase
VSRSVYIYGRHPVSEALKSRPRDVQRVYLVGAGRASRFTDIERAAERHDIPVVQVSKSRLGDLVGGAPHQGVAAAVQPFSYADVDQILARARSLGEPPLVLALDQIQDPHNLGSLVRSALALGAHGALFPKDRSTEVTPAVVKASAGATAQLPIARVTNLRRALNDLKEAGLWIVGAASNGDRVVDELDLAQPTALVIGSEGKGLRRMVAETCDLLVQIPMTGRLDSLNAGVAGGILLYEVARQRRVAAAGG